MARLIWTEPALRDLDTIAEYIALDKPEAARKFVRRVFAAADRLARFPLSGRKPAETKGLPYREIVVPPCRIFYRVDRKAVLLLHVMRGEPLLRVEDLEEGEP